MTTTRLTVVTLTDRCRAPYSLRRCFSTFANTLVDKQVSAFTLVELLVVIAIIALLAALLLPSLRSARKRAQAVVCLSNLHQISLAVQSYAGDYKGALMWPYNIVGPYWGNIMVTTGCLGATNTNNVPVLKCPTKPMALGLTFSFQQTYGLRALGSGYANGPYQPGYNPINLRQIADASQYFIITEAWALLGGKPGPFAFCDNWHAVWLQHFQRANATYADGSVRATDANYFLNEPSIENLWIKNNPNPAGPNPAIYISD